MTTTNSEFKEIPLIDISTLLDANSSQQDVLKTAQEIGNACRDVGFLYIKNHGISEEQRARMMSGAKEFFDLPTEEKMDVFIGKSKHYRGYVPLAGEVTQNKKDWHEAFDISRELPDDHPDVVPEKPLHGPNQWPKHLPDFRVVMQEYGEAMTILGAKITECLALSLGLEADYFEPYTRDALWNLRILHYPPYEEDKDEDVGEGIGEHIDYGFVTILMQDEVGGLEVRNAVGEWIKASYIPGTFIVNIGHMVQRWTNDRYKATWHRVRTPAGKRRYSIPFFFSPNYDTVVEPLEICCDADNPPRYEPFHYGKYVAEAFARSYGAHYQEA